MKRALAFLFATSSIVGSVSIAYAQHAMMDDKELMTKLKDAAPARILQDATVLNMGADGKMKDMEFKGMALEGYDNVKKKFVSSWIDNMGTGVMLMEGKWDEPSKSLVLTGSMKDPMTGKDCQMKEVHKWTDNNNQKMEMYSTVDGKEFKSMELTLTRK